MKRGEPPAFRHVVLISLDTTRADRLGPYGFPDAHTPHLDRLAREGLLFRHHYAVAPTTLAAHTSLFTGLHPHRHGTPRNDHAVADTLTLLPERLHTQGFVSGAALGAMPLGSATGFTQGFDWIDEDFSRSGLTHLHGDTERRGDQVTAAALRFLDGLPADDSRRIFLFAHYFDAHAPYDAPPEFRALFPSDPRLPHAGELRHLARTRWQLRQGRPDTARHVEALKVAYQAGIAAADHHVGALLDGLQARGLLDDALVIVTADHGEAFELHADPFDHGATVHDDALHVPLILRFPGAWAGGQTSDALVSQVDLLPTLADLLDLDVDDLDGLSFLPTLRGEQVDRPPVYAEATKPHLKPSDGAWTNAPLPKAARDLTTKVILDPRLDQAARYSVSDDPDELRPRLANSHPLLAAVQAWAASADPLPPQPITSARLRAQLAALGYADDPGGDEAPDGADP